ncbi:TlpA disulfide reductase family protein [Algoriphagus sp.]|uniref:TlpA family protein disulfide reductase n=1 Tax=Algoriphagus sp. TaxID=1872435 RepID=UPI00260F100A|nr:TlpA disulfide reductase family protein [Algoriphagus sp.]
MSFSQVKSTLEIKLIWVCRFVLACCFFFPACQPKEASGSGEDSRGKLRLEAEFTDLDQQKFNLSDFKGRPIVLHFWATWCKPCIEEFPSLREAQPRLEKENVQFLIASDEELGLIEKFQKRFQTGLNLIQLSKGSLSEFGIYALPTTLILNEEGEQIHRISGKIDWSKIESFGDLKSDQP